MVFCKYPYEVDMTRNGTPLVPMLTVCTLQEDVFIMLWDTLKACSVSIKHKKCKQFFSHCCFLFL
jgi:hypothetical protein